MIAAAAVAALALAAGDRWLGPFYSGASAFQAGLAEVCLPLVVDRADRAALRTRRGLKLISRPEAADHVYRLTSIQPVQVTAWADGSCSVQMPAGDVRALSGVMEQVLRPRPEGFKPGRAEAPAPDLRRVSYCSAQRPHPVVVTIVTAEPGAKNRMAASSTVFRSENPGEPPFCASPSPK